jgi:OFA family oxalate/formate antiporter-like MFS transporter
LTYACVAPPARKWFPDKPAFAVSTTVMGFGLSALVFAPLKSEYLIPNQGIENTFLLLSVIILVVVLLASRIIKNPPDGWTPPNWKPKRMSTDLVLDHLVDNGFDDLWGTHVAWVDPILWHFHWLNHF